MEALRKTLIAALIIGCLAACSSAPDGVVDIGNPPDTSTITPQKAMLAGLEIECPLGFALTASETEASCVGDAHSWFATAYDDESGSEDAEAVAKLKIRGEYNSFDQDLIEIGDVGEDWIFARAYLRLEIFTVYVSTVDATIVELRTRYTDEADRPEVIVTPRPRPR